VNKPRVWPPFEEWAEYAQWKLPAKYRTAIPRMLRKYAAVVDDEAVKRIERICATYLLRKYLHSKMPLESHVHKALAPIGERACELRTLLEALAPPVKGTFKRRFKAERRAWAGPERLELVSGPQLTPETVLMLIERTVYNAVKGPRPQGWKKASIDDFASIWMDLTDQPADVKQNSAGKHGDYQEAGPFPDFVRLCFEAMGEKPPTIDYYLKK